MKKYALILATLLWLLISCKEQKNVETDNSTIVTVKTTKLSKGNIEKGITLNGKTVYLKKNSVVSPIAGFIVKTYVGYGDNVKKNEVLFEIQTKENKAFQNIDSSFLRKSFLKILAPSDGIIEEITINQGGAFISEGTLLCNIVEIEDLMIQLNSPFEYSTQVKPGTQCQVLLADKTILDARVIKVMPLVNPVSQTQNILIKPQTNRQIPENLNVTVKIKGPIHTNVFLLPKVAVLNNEIQNEYWVMKVIHDSLAVKVPVIKGFENDSILEIEAGSLKEGDLLIIDGAYGLSDSTKVKIVK